MKCELCSKEGTTVHGLRFTITACEEHASQLIALEKQYIKRTEQLKRITEYKKQTLTRTEKNKTRYATARLTTRGKINKMPCSVCGETSQVHHNDYKNPEDIQFLCEKHHRELHRNQNKY